MIESLNIRQQRFVNAYTAESNATKACVLAGYSPEGARNQGSRLLARRDIQAALLEAEQSKASRAAMTIDRLVHELTKVSTSNHQDYWVLDDNGVSQPLDILDIHPDAAAAIQEYTRDHNGTIRIKLWPKLAAAEQIAKTLGAFIDRHEVTVSVEKIERVVVDSIDGECTPLQDTQEATPTLPIGSEDKTVTVDCMATQEDCGEGGHPLSGGAVQKR